MPKVPQSEVPQFHNPGTNSVPVGGAPGLNYRVNDGMFALAGAMDNVSWKMHGVAMDVLDVYSYKKHADDMDNTAQIELVTRQKYNDLRTYMQENPGDYEKFNERYEQTRKDLDAEVKPYVDKLSNDGRKRTSVYLQERAQDAAQFTRNIAFHADVSVKRGNFENRIKQYAKTGDVANAENQLALAVDSKLFRPDEVETYRNHINEMRDFGAAERIIESGDAAIAERLAARNDDGSYKEFGALSEDTRNQLQRYAAQQQNAREVAADDQLYARLLNGENIDEKAIDAMAAAGRISLKHRNRQVKMIRDFRDDAARQREKTDKEQARHDCDALEIEIMDYQFSKDPAEREKQKNELNRKIYDRFAKEHPGMVKTLKNQLSESVNAIEKADGGYKNTPNYLYAMERVDGLKSDLHSKKDSSAWFSFGYVPDDDGDDIKAENHGLLKLKIDHFIKNNPAATQKDIDAVIDTTKAQINATAVSNRLATWAAGSAPRVGGGAAKMPGGKAESNGGKRTYDSRELLAFSANAALDEKEAIKANASRRIAKFKEEGRIDMADIVERKKDKQGREMWQLKNGKRVYADEYK